MTYDWRQGGPEAAEQAYCRWARRNTKGPDWPAFDEGFVRGADWLFHATSALSPYISNFLVIALWLRDHEIAEQGREWGESNLVADARDAYVADEDAELEQLPF